MIKLKKLLKEGSFSMLGGIVSLSPINRQSVPTGKSTSNLSSLVEDEWVGEREERIDENEFLETVSKYNEFGKSLHREDNLRDVAQTLSKIAETARVFTLQETEGWFDKITVNRNMKELSGLSKNFNKVAKEAQSLQERMSGLYEDMGYILNRYYDMDEGKKSYRHGDEHDEEMDEGKKEEYEKFFNAALKKFDASSPADMSDEKKKEFFNYVDKEWSGSDESD